MNKVSPEKDLEIYGGLEANRPDAGMVGRYYFCIDSNKWCRDNGSSWDEVSGGAAGSHDLGGALHGADTLANLNTKVSDATLDDSSVQCTRTPPSHSHSPTIKSGTTTTDGSGDASVAFGTAFPDANYAIILTAQDTGDTMICMWNNKAAGGFDIHTENDQGNNEANVVVDWVAVAYYDP